MKETRVIISGGGTGGHIFPALSIANAIKEIRPNAKILFVGAEGRMEMQRVPAAGYEIKGLPVRGLIRPLWNPKNVGVLLDFLRSKKMVRNTIKEFRPQVAVGVGGYASAATLNAAYEMGIPCLIQEQNSFAGLTNKTLAKKARKICVAYDGMERFFPKENIILTGNPVRQELCGDITREEAAKVFGLSSNKPTILMIGGSLGARTLNNSVLSALKAIQESNVQFIWQTGSYYKDTIKNELKQKGKPENLVVMDFIKEMDKAYRIADLVISRAEDHQTHNAMALVNREAAIIVRDDEAEKKLIPLALQTVADTKKLDVLGTNARRMALLDSARIIAEEVLKLADETEKQTR